MELTLAMIKPNTLDSLADIEQCIRDRGFSILEVRYGTNSGYCIARFYRPSSRYSAVYP